jgi:hypothetical protein
MINWNRLLSRYRASARIIRPVESSSLIDDTISPMRVGRFVPSNGSGSGAAHPIPRAARS